MYTAKNPPPSPPLRARGRSMCPSPVRSKNDRPVLTRLRIVSLCPSKIRGSLDVVGVMASRFGAFARVPCVVPPWNRARSRRSTPAPDEGAPGLWRGPDLADLAESLGFDAQGVIEPAAEVLERHVRGELHHLLFGEVRPQGSEQFVRDIVTADGHPVGVLEHQPFERRKHRAGGVVAEVRELFFSYSGRLARGGVDIHSERTPVDGGDPHVHEIPQRRRDEGGITHRLAPLAIRALQGGTSGPHLCRVERCAVASGLLHQELAHVGGQRRRIWRGDAAHGNPPSGACPRHSSTAHRPPPVGGVVRWKTADPTRGYLKIENSISLAVMNSSSAGVPCRVLPTARLIAGMIAPGSVTRSPYPPNACASAA